MRKANTMKETKITRKMTTKENRDNQRELYKNRTVTYSELQEDTTSIKQE